MKAIAIFPDGTTMETDGAVIIRIPVNLQAKYYTVWGYKRYILVPTNIPNTFNAIPVCIEFLDSLQKIYLN